jgi:hypothetical protein
VLSRKGIAIELRAVVSILVLEFIARGDRLPNLQRRLHEKDTSDPTPDEKRTFWLADCHHSRLDLAYRPSNRHLKAIEGGFALFWTSANR